MQKVEQQNQQTQQSAFLKYFSSHSNKCPDLTLRTLKELIGIVPIGTCMSQLYSCVTNTTALRN